MDALGMFTPGLAVLTLIAFTVYRLAALPHVEEPKEPIINWADHMSKFPMASPAEKAILLQLDPRPWPTAMIQTTDAMGRPQMYALINGRNYFLDAGEYEMFQMLPKAPPTNKL